ncbi:MAG: TIGR03564 family F420-dependent LLM class oxidoreductase [Dehalococcoidia bacterium]|nr:TIGR03564 family F420-dependent LLM class oxidoreductase [Dehalococcoidia bacterium]MCB9484910.1 TIGR03564 family F420-dependent LLM class oxidoreductase [Thermoflexaceae bacterium]
MRIVSTPFGTSLQAKIDAIKSLEADGFTGAWLPGAGHDVLTTMALAGAVTTSIELGSFVQPTFARHPVSMAQGALAAQAASGNRFVLGLGLSHKSVIEGAWGLDFSRPVRHMREYLTVLNPLLRGERVDFEGEDFRIHSQVQVPDAAPPSVVIAALGPQMLRLAGRMCDGTALWMAGPKYIEEVVVPELGRAAREAGRPAPRIIAGVPIVVTSDSGAARERIATAYAMYGTLPSYQRVISGSGASGPEDLAVIGTEEQVESQLRRWQDAGVTDFYAAIDGENAEVRAHTRDFLKSLLPAI